MARVLIVEDNPDMRSTLTDYLTSEGFSVRAVDSTEDGIDELDEHDFDIALVDIGLPGKSGFDLIEYARDQSLTLPMIVLTARSDIEDKLKGFDVGANDYVVKPFNLRELAARMRSHLRRSGPSNETAEVASSRFFISPEQHIFTVDGKQIQLTNTEFRIFHMLIMHLGSVVTTSDLIEFVWGESHLAETPPIRIHIANLRRKIGDKTFSTIKTVAGIGYKLDDTTRDSHAA